MKRGNSTSIMERFGVTYRQLNYWYRQGYLSPIGDPPEVGGGRGTSRVFTDAEVTQLELMLGLVRAGVKPDVAARIARRDTQVTDKLIHALEKCAP